jgi:hypothetical protein
VKSFDGSLITKGGKRVAPKTCPGLICYALKLFMGDANIWKIHIDLNGQFLLLYFSCLLRIAMGIEALDFLFPPEFPLLHFP